jgi:hypothetical protein
MFQHKAIAGESLATEETIIVDKTDLQASYYKIKDLFLDRDNQQTRKYYEWVIRNIDALIGELKIVQQKDNIFSLNLMKAHLLNEMDMGEEAERIYFNDILAGSSKKVTQSIALDNILSQACLGLANIRFNNNDDEAALKYLMMSVNFLFQENLFHQEPLGVEDFSDTLELFEEIIQHGELKKIPNFVVNRFIDFKNYFVQLESNLEITSLVKFTQRVLAIRLLDKLVRYYGETDNFTKKTINERMRSTLEYFYDHMIGFFAALKKSSELQDYEMFVDPDERHVYLREIIGSDELLAQSAEFIEEKDQRLQKEIDNYYTMLNAELLKTSKIEYLKRQEEKENYYREQLKVLRYLVAHKNETEFSGRFHEFFAAQLPKNVVLPEEDIISWLSLLGKLENYHDYLRVFFADVKKNYPVSKVQKKIAEVRYLRALLKNDLGEMSKALDSYIEIGGKINLCQYARQVYFLVKEQQTKRRDQLWKWLKIWSANYDHVSTELDREFIWYSEQENNKTKLKILENIRQPKLRYQKMLEVVKAEKNLYSDYEMIDLYKRVISFTLRTKDIQKYRLEFAQYLLVLAGQKEADAIELEKIKKLSILNFKNIKPKDFTPAQNQIYRQLEEIVGSFDVPMDVKDKLDKYSERLLADLEFFKNKKLTVDINSKAFKILNGEATCLISSLVADEIVLPTYYVLSEEKEKQMIVIHLSLFADKLKRNGKFQPFYIQIEKENWFMKKINIFFVKSFVQNLYYSKPIKIDGVSDLEIRRFELLEKLIPGQALQPDLTIDFAEGYPVAINGEPFVVKLDDTGRMELKNLTISGLLPDEADKLLENSVKITKNSLVLLREEISSQDQIDDVLAEFRKDPGRFIQIPSNAATFKTRNIYFTGLLVTFKLYEEGKKTLADVKREIRYLLDLLTIIDREEFISIYNYDSIDYGISSYVKKGVSISNIVYLDSDRYENLRYIIGKTLIFIFELTEYKNPELYDYAFQYFLGKTKTIMREYDLEASFRGETDEKKDWQYQLLAGIIQDLLDNNKDERFKQEIVQQLFGEARRTFFMGAAICDLSATSNKLYELNYPEYFSFKNNGLAQLKSMELGAMQTGDFIDDFFDKYTQMKLEVLKMRGFDFKDILDQHGFFKKEFLKALAAYPGEMVYEDHFKMLNTLFLDFFALSLGQIAKQTDLKVIEKEDAILFKRGLLKQEAVIAAEVYQTLLKKLFKYYTFIGEQKLFLDNLKSWQNDLAGGLDKLVVQLKDLAIESYFALEINKDSVAADLDFKQEMIEEFLEFLAEQVIIDDSKPASQTSGGVKRKKTRRNRR